MFTIPESVFTIDRNGCSFSSEYALIQEHGPDQAQFVVEYAVNSARERFGSPPELFGGALRFAEEALVAHERRVQTDRAEREERRKREEETSRLEAERQARQELSPKQRFELRISRFPKGLYSPRKLAEVRRQIAAEEGYQLPA